MERYKKLNEIFEKRAKKFQKFNANFFNLDLILKEVV